MATTNKPKSYISFELEWLDTKVKQLQAAIDSYDLLNLTDRYGPRELPNGKIVDGIVANKEQQMKAVTDIMEKLQKMLPALEQMREKDEAKKIETRKGMGTNGIMDYMNQKG
mgnify:CR=1 FL=1